jgi:hypothetical protein
MLKGNGPNRVSLLTDTLSGTDQTLPSSASQFAVASVLTLNVTALVVVLGKNGCYCVRLTSGRSVLPVLAIDQR